MDYQTAISAACRTLTARGSLTLTTGYTCALSADDILSFRFEEGVQGGDMLLGGAVGAHGQLTLASPAGAWLPGGERLGTRTLNGAAATLEIGVLAGDETLYQPCGRFIVSRIESGEGQDSVTLSGYDEMVHALAAPFADTLDYPQPLSAVLAHILAQCDLPYDTLPDCNGAVSIPARPDWGEGCTLRRALGMAAGAMGCFARVTPQGRLRLQSVWPASFRALATGKCLSMSLSSLDFALNRVRALHNNEETTLAEAALNAALPAGASNTLEIRDNALLRAGSAQSLTSGLLAALSGMTITPFEADIPGDPALEIGQRLRITDLRGAAHDSCVFARTLSFGEDFTVSLSCDPDTAGISLPRALSGSGLLSSAALGDGVVTARKLAVGAVDAEAISARSITADKIALGTLTGDSGVFGSLSADLITAGKLSADRLIVGGSEFSIVRALNQLAQSLAEADNRIDGSVLADRTISAVKVTDDFGAGLELSSNQAVLLLAGKLDGTNSHLELTQEAINMVGGDINIATDSLEIRGIEAGDERMSLDQEGLSAPRVVVKDHFSAPNAVLKHLTSDAPWQGGIQSTLDALPRYLTKPVTIAVPAGTYMENVVIAGFWGEALTLAFAPGVYLRGTVEIRHCGEVSLQAASLGDACVYPTGAQTPVTARAVQRLTLKSLYLSGYRGRSTATDGSEYCVQAQGCNTVIDGCGMEYSRSACLYAAGGTASMHACLGGCTGDNPATNANLGYAARGAEGAHIALEDTYPLAFIAHYCGSSMATYRVGTGCAGAAGGMSEPGSARVTRTFLPSFHCTYTGSSRKAYPNNKVIWQGVYGQYRAGYNDFNTGTLWFDEASAALAGKTIHQATLSLRRSNGGSSAARNVYLGAVALRQADWATTYRPAFTAPSALPAYPAGQLSRECEGVYDITSLMAAVQQGYGIGVYEPCAAYSGGYSPHYTMFYGLGSDFVPVLTVTYS